MAVLSYLPTIDVYIGFNPTASGATLTTAYSVALPASGASNTYWTNVSSYLMDLKTHEGRQHFLDRMQAGTFTGTFDGRDGFFWNGTVNTTGYTISPRQPIAVTATYSGTTYRLFLGIIDSAKERITDQLNSDVIIDATDQLKQLSLKKMNNPAFWQSYTNSASVQNYYSATTNQTAVITQATGNGTTITYTGFNNFTAGMKVTITGLTIFSGASLNMANVTVATASSSQFTVTNTTVGVSNGGGSAYNCLVNDLKAGSNGIALGTVSFPNAGAIIYIDNGCIDLANGGNKATGYIQLGTYGSAQGGLDFWILGQGLAGSDPIQGLQCSIGGTNYPLSFTVTTTGLINIAFTGLGTTVTGSQPINDGFWHHIGLVCDSSGHLQLYTDGVFTSLASIGVVLGFTTYTNLTIGGPDLLTAAMVDEIVVSSQTSLSTLQGEVSNRYVAGSLLQLPTNPSAVGISSGDRIAQILCLAGYGTVTGGAVSLNSNLYYINNGSVWSGYNVNNGFIKVQPWYWDAPVFNSTALDLIYEVCDTDIGRFWQKGDGTFAFHNQKFFGTWQWNTITNLSSNSTAMTFTVANTLSAGQTVAVEGCYPTGYNGVWTVATASGTQFTVTSTLNPGTGVTFGMVGGWLPTTYTPTTDHVWTDDASSNYAYEGSSLDAPRDEADLWTEVIVTPQAGVDQMFQNLGAQNTYGYNSLVKSGTLHTSLTLALSTACYLGVLFRSPLQRIQSVTLYAQTNNGANNSAMLNVPVDDVVTFKRTPPNASAAGSISRNYVVECIDREFNSEQGLFQASYTLDPYPIRG
jgi:hypothetical protein